MSIKRVVLCGFMGCGKTTVATSLAKVLGWQLIDTDLYIEQQQGMGIPEIFEQLGEERFREMEHEAVQALSKRESCVISTGGQVMAVERNAKLLHKPSSLVVYLDPGFKVCYSRIKATDRPLVRQNSKEQLRELYEYRSGLYAASADLRVDSSQPLSAIISKIRDCF